MSGRIVARTLAAAALTGFLAVSVAGTANALNAPPGGGAVEDLIELPDGFQPEGLASGTSGTAYVGSLADGDSNASCGGSGSNRSVTGTDDAAGSALPAASRRHIDTVHSPGPGA